MQSSKLLTLNALALMVTSLSSCILEGPAGKDGADGARGPAGATADVLTSTGTVLSMNYTTGNPGFASIRICGCLWEPTVLFAGIQNQNGVMANENWSAIVYSNGADSYGVNSQSGYYVLILDTAKSFLQKNYKVKYIE